MGRHSNIRKDFNKTSLKSDERGHHVMIRGSIQQKDVTIVSIYESNGGAFGYLKQMSPDPKARVDSNNGRLQHSAFAKGQVNCSGNQNMITLAKKQLK